MTNQLTEVELNLRIGEAITEKADLTIDDLMENFFGNETTSVPSVLKSYVISEFVRQCKHWCRISAKKTIAAKLRNGSSIFIQQFVNAKTEDELISVFSSDLSTRLKILKHNNSLGSFLAECTRIFNKIREKFSPAQSEDKFRYFLSDWLHSGSMPLKIWKQLHEWKIKGSTLNNLKKINALNDLHNDTNWREFMRLMKAIKTDDFVDAKNLQTILDIYFSTPEISACEGSVKLIGRIVYLSEWLERIHDLIRSSSITEVVIYAEDNVGIDCDLTDNSWCGKNLIIVSQTVYVWQEVKICLSGESYLAENRKAKSARSTAFKGEDGRDGRAGESSGNLAILATKMINCSKLSVELNGGRGEDGEHGGDGCDGIDGVGVTQKQIDKLIVDYSSLYFDSWKTFDNYSPPSKWEKVSNNGKSGNYLYRTYKDKNGRKITYSLAADKGWVYTTYELYFLICGSDGTSGSSGGSNGIGGQGGYNGTCTVKNPETNQEYQIKLIREGKNSGPNGNNGQVGLSGKCGVNGNDMVLIDRSAKEPSKHYEGSSDKKLDWNYVYKADYKSRLDGLKRYHEKDNACFIKFQYGETIKTSKMRAAKAQERKVRKTSSEAVAKQSISIGKVLNEAQSLFGKQNAFLADACKESAKASLSEEIEEDEEIEENVSEEVVLLREKEDKNKSTMQTYECDKKGTIIQTPELFITSIKSIGRRTTLNKLFQLLFDFFKVEFPPVILESVGLNVVFHQTKYCRQMQSSFALVLMSALQSNIVNGKSFMEIKQFSLTLSTRRKLKVNLTRLRQKLQNISAQTDIQQVQPSLTLFSGDDRYFGVKEGSLSATLAPYIDSTNVRKVVKSFFSQYAIKEVSLKLLNAFNTYLSQMKPHYEQQLKLFATDENFDWLDKTSSEAYLDSLSSWLIEDAASKKKEEKIAVSGKDDEAIHHTKQQQKPHESAFKSFFNALLADHTYWSKLIEPVNHIIGKSEEYKARFGFVSFGSIKKMFQSAISKVSSNDSEMLLNIQQAKYLIKIYYISKSILSFNRTLYEYNAMMMKEQGKFPDNLNYSDKDDRYDTFISQYTANPLQCESDQCEVYMMKHGLNCKPFRYLLSKHLNIKLCSYRKVSFQTLQKVETLNENSNRCEIMWLNGGELPTGIAIHENFRTLISAQSAVISKYRNILDSQIESMIKVDFSKKENIQSFVSYFPSALQNSATEWIESYMTAIDDQSLIQFLHNRMWVDGCHLSLFELQSILVLLISLKKIFHCDVNYLLLLVNSVEQAKLIDVFLYLRLQYHLEKRFSANSVIFSSIKAIQNSRYKSLLVVKLSHYDMPIDEEDIYKICLMLQNASNGSEQLEKIGLDEWISIARKQKWSEIGNLLEIYGSIGYYLGVLDNKGFKKEEFEMRKVFDEAIIIPEKMIALYTQWIVTKEINGNEKFFVKLKKIFLRANDYPGLIDKHKKHQLLTNEIEQQQLISWLQKGSVYEDISSTNDREIDELADKISGLHDSPEDAFRRKESIQKIVCLLKENDENKSKSIFWLNKFDKALFKFYRKHLRNTQKLAILCAVESDRHVLQQVNTGEGKSFIIAAIATIQIKLGKRFVDIITSSPVLAQRDSEKMLDIYRELGVTVAHNCNEKFEERKQAYAANIVYGDIARFQRDHLLHTFYKKMIKGDRTQVAVIVDEVDNMLLDNGNNMLYLSHSIPGMDLLDSLLIYIKQIINSPIYTGEAISIEDVQKEFDVKTIKNKILADLFGKFTTEDLRSILKYKMNEAKIESIYEMLIRGNIIDSEGNLRIHTHKQLEMIDETLKKIDVGYVKLIKACFKIVLSRERSIELPFYLRNFAKLHLDEFIENCKSSLFLEPNTGYVLDVDRTGKLTSSLEPLITIIDTNTGADLSTSQWSGGLHQFLQLKHGCRLSPISLKAVFVSNVAFLKRYQYINGLSGTLGSAEESKTLINLYNADLIKIPTNKPKTFYEHVPVIVTSIEQWISSIYNEICDQVSVKRSVLLICEDIKQVEDVQNEISKLFAMDVHATQETKECFNNVTLYKREHDEFNFEGKHEFEPCRLIIATNLAGRGTDIQLSSDLVKAGGLHVITAFMPKNCRIEEQAFGRAARNGQPGSGQIISFAEPLNDVIQPSVFQLKMFRDNAEVHRLQSLKNFYDYHTEIEEACLQKFYNYCESALSSIYSKTNGETSDDSLPTLSQVVYFALLDQWALWLDSKAPLIKQCSLEYSQNLKETIISSVDEFLNNHPFGNQSNCFDVAKKWLNSPQSLLNIGIIQMFHNNGFNDAEETFNKILEDGHEFAAEAFYYKACMRMRNFSAMRTEQNSMKLTKQENFKENIKEAIEFFYKSRTAFFHRLQRKQREASIVAQMIEKLPKNNPKTSGYASQVKSIVTYIQLILANIDYLLGSPCQPKMFTGDGISEEYSIKIHDSLKRQSIISPTILTGCSIENWQVEPFKQKYKLHRKQIETLIKRLAEDPVSLVYDDHIVLDQIQLLEYCPLSTKSEFWAELEAQKALMDSVVCLAIKDWSVLSTDLTKHLKKLSPYTVRNNDEARTLLRYSSDVELGTLYKIDEIQKTMADKPDLMNEINKLIDSEVLKFDKFSRILIVPEDMAYFSDFDGVTIDDLEEFFNLDNHGAAWILNILEENGILKCQTVKMARFISNSEKWTSLVRAHLEPNAEPKENDLISKILYENAGILQKIKNNRKILNLTKDVIGEFCKMPDENEETLSKFYTFLQKELLEPYFYNIWRLNSKLDCSSLPSCIVGPLEEFLSDRFAYTFALEEICLSLEEANKHPLPRPSQVFLPENPFREVYEDLVNFGLAIPSRIYVTSDTIDDIDFEDFKYEESIKSVVHSNRLKLYDQTDFHMGLVPFSTYVNDQGFLVDSDLKNIINNGLKVVVSRKNETSGSWLLNNIIGSVSSAWNFMKTVASSIGSFCYSAVQFVCKLPVQIYDKVSEYVSPYIKQVGEFIMSIAQPLLNTKFGKAAVTGLKYVADFIEEAQYKIVEGTEYLFDKIGEGVDYVSKKATELVDWVESTSLVQGVIKNVKRFGSWIASSEIFKAAVNMATYIYSKMSNFCTAIAESYKYYNQCRTMARRIALEKQGQVDEHMILKTFHGISQPEDKKNKKDATSDDNIRKIIESWRLPLIESMIKMFDKKLEQLPTSKYSINFVKSYLKTTAALNSFNSYQTELSNLLSFYAWNTQILYFKQMKASVKTPELLLEKIKLIKIEGIPLEMQFYIEDAIDQILQDLQNRFDDDGYESESGENKANQIHFYDTIESLKLSCWKEALKLLFVCHAKKEIELVFIEKTIAIVLDYTASLRDTNIPESEVQFNFTQEDKSLKQALIEYSSSNKSKQKAQFLKAELHFVTRRLIELGEINEQKKLIKNCIRYGYPLPLSSASIIVSAFNNFLKRSNIYNAGIEIEITDDNGNNGAKYGQGKGKLQMRHFNGLIFLCQSDYRSFIGMSDQMYEEVYNAFVYEAFIFKLKAFITDQFPKKSETLREELLKEF